MSAKTNSHSVAMGYILWIFGFMGAHRFYFGRPVSGTIWFATFGIFGLGWLIDVALIPGMDKTADIKYVTGPINYDAAWILLTFFGFLGIHRFYMGKIGTGLLFLFTGGLLGMGWLYDFCKLNEQISVINSAKL